MLERSWTTARPTLRPSATDLLALVVSLNVKRRNLTAGQRAIAAAEAWDNAEKEGKVAERGEIGRNRSPKVGNLIKAPRDYFAKLFGVGKGYVEQALAECKRVDECKSWAGQGARTQELCQADER